MNTVTSILQYGHLCLYFPLLTPCVFHSFRSAIDLKNYQNFLQFQFYWKQIPSVLRKGEIAEYLG